MESQIKLAWDRLSCLPALSLSVLQSLQVPPLTALPLQVPSVGVTVLPTGAPFLLYSLWMLPDASTLIQLTLRSDLDRL